MSPRKKPHKRMASNRDGEKRGGSASKPKPKPKAKPESKLEPRLEAKSEARKRASKAAAPKIGPMSHTQPWRPGSGLEEAHESKPKTKPKPEPDGVVQGKDVGARMRIVGIGASAGGLEALEALFQNMPADSGLAFIIIQHLATSHQSIMAELLGRHTAMPCRQAEQMMRVEPNSVYLIPPNSTLTMTDGVIKLATPSEPEGHRSPIDAFFSSLAAEHGEDTVGIVLSGAGSDGTLGIKAIKEHGGLTMAQAGGRHDSMPRHAIATGVVDYVLPVEEMPAALLTYLRYRDELEKGQRLPTIFEEIESKLSELAFVLRRKTGHDFSQYKPNTIVRRTARRMQLLQIEKFQEYLELLREDPAEVEALFKDLLIGVTYFFRDPEAFKALAEGIVPKIFENKGADESVRIWVPGCATGEESYSIAILLREHMSQLDAAPRVQLFASDIDDDALDIGRGAMYGKAVPEQVTPERLERFFVKQDGSFKVVKDIREMCLFSVHNLIKDPPFSRLDLISCRNVMIYLDSDLQRRLMHLFHYALRPGGFLFLGPSESVSGHTDLFEPVEHGKGIFKRREFVIHAPVEFPVSDTRFMLHRHGEKIPRVPKPEIDVPRTVERLLLTNYAPASVVINRKSEVVYFGGHTGKYLEPAHGHPTTDLMEMARRGLKQELRSVIYESMKTRKRVTRRDVRVQTNGDVTEIELIVHPLSASEKEPQLYMVIFQDKGGGSAAPAPHQPASRKTSSAERRGNEAVRQLEEELNSTKQHLQSTVEELEASNEELKSMNEELLSMNEELQSTNEELETSREELQSVNEELETVNSELGGKVKELGRANDDLKNFMQSTQIATIFLDNDLRIKGFTPAIVEIFRLIESDVGRPITDIASRFALGDLVDDIKHVLRTLVPRERQVKVAQQNDHWHLMRILPYRTQNNVINGVVVTFTDLREIKRAEEADAKLGAIVESSTDAIVGKTLEGVIQSWNGGAQHMFGYDASEVVGRRINLLIPQELQDQETQILQMIRRGEHVEPFETTRVAKGGQRIDVSLAISPVRDASGAVIGCSSVARDMTERRRNEAHLQGMVHELDHRVKNTLALVSALASQSLREAPSNEGFRASFEGRLQALAVAHRRLSQAQWRGAQLEELLNDTIAPHVDRNHQNFQVTGPQIVLAPQATLAMAIAFHELATNAVKYGPFSNSHRGRVAVDWALARANGEKPRLHIRWQESGGPAVRTPTKSGLGMQLIERSVQSDIGGRFSADFAAEGFRCTIDLPWRPDAAWPASSP